MSFEYAPSDIKDRCARTVNKIRSSVARSDILEAQRHVYEALREETHLLRKQLLSIERELHIEIKKNEAYEKERACTSKTNKTTKCSESMS